MNSTNNPFFSDNKRNNETTSFGEPAADFVIVYWQKNGKKIRKKNQPAIEGTSNVYYSYSGLYNSRFGGGIFH